VTAKPNALSDGGRETRLRPCSSVSANLRNNSLTKISSARYKKTNAFGGKMLGFVSNYRGFSPSSALPTKTVREKVNRLPSSLLTSVSCR
jgi:hypothetical protein